VVTALTESAATQRQWEKEYRATAAQLNDEPSTKAMWLRFAAQAKGTAWAFEVSADMISKYVGVLDE
jgi:hypothetical protein